MSSRKRNTLIMLITAVVLGIAVVVSAIILILQRVGGIDSITMAPDFADVELDVNQEYTVTITSDPEGAKVEKFDFLSDSSAVVFEYQGDNKGVIRTLGTGEVSIWVKYKGVESQKLTYRIVDKAQQAAQAEAEAAAAAEAAAQAEAEAAAAAAEAEAAAQVVYVRVIKDSVNVRSQGNTDCDTVGKAAKGDTFEVVAVEGEWTQIKYNGDTVGYIRNDMIETVSDSSDASAESTDASAETAQPAEEKKEEAKQEDTKTEEQKKQEEEAKKAEEAKKTEEDAAKKAEEEAKKAAEDAQKAAEEAAAAQQAAAAAAAAAGPVPVWSFDGYRFSAAEVQIFKNNWGGLEGGWEAWAPHHSGAELKTLCRNSGVPESQMCQ